MFKCTQCQAVQPESPPPYNMPPSSCSSCGGAVTQIRDTTPAPPGDEQPPASTAAPVPPPPPGGMTAEEAAEWGVTGKLPARFNPSEPSLPAPGPLELLKAGELKPSGQRVFVSTMLYALSRELGSGDALRELGQQVEQIAADPTWSGPSLPVAHTISAALHLFDVTLLVDGGAASVGKARSRAAHAFLASNCDVWISCDDDVQATGATLAALVEAVQGEKGICIAPCLLRERLTVNVDFGGVPTLRTLPGGAQVCTAKAGGFGLVAMSREALKAMGALVFVDDDGQEKAAYFLEDLQNRKWLGEDLAFFSSVPPDVRVAALLTGHTVHAGVPLELAELLPLVQKVQQADQKQDAPAALEASKQV